MSETVVLAFSGGLDTSYCLLDLKSSGHAVHTVFVDTGGVDRDEVAAIAARARELGATRHYTLEAGEDLFHEFVRPLLWSGARVNGQYPMLCSDRYVIVRRALELCDELGTRTFAHGCTGMGNDQLRFDQTVRSLGDYEILAPVRELQARTDRVRDHEMAVLREAGHDVPSASKAYSINENLLGVTISGSEIDRFEAPSADTCQWVRPRDEWPEGPVTATVGFEGGVPFSLDGEPVTGPELIGRLNRQFGACGVGRHVYTGDVSIGLKGRIVFECPGVDVLMTAHDALAQAVMTRLQNQFHHQVAQRWAELVYTGFFYEPHKFDLEAYLAHSQRHVSGLVTVASEGGSVLATAIDSGRVLRDASAVYAQSASWTPEEAVGFIKLLGQSSTLSARINGVEK